MPGRNFSLTDHLSGFVDAQVRSGRHQNASKVVREALRRYEDAIRIQEAKIAEITDLIREGRNSKARGDFTTVSSRADADALFEQIRTIDFACDA